MHIHNRRVAAPVPKLPTMTYGRYAVRFRADPLPGYKTAWLLWPDSGVWPRDGEIDFPEGNLDSTINGYVHHMNGKSGSDTDSFKTPALYSTWHTAVIEWTAGKITFLLDGQVIGTTTKRDPLDPHALGAPDRDGAQGTRPRPLRRRRRADRLGRRLGALTERGAGAPNLSRFVECWGPEALQNSGGSSEPSASRSSP